MRVTHLSTISGKLLMPTAMALAAIGFSGSAQAQIVTNGGFEQPKVSDTCCNTAPPATVPGWDVNSGNVNVVNGTFDSTNGNLAAEGSQYLDLVGQGGVGSISQTLALNAGQVYNLSFAYSHNLFSPAEATSASAEVTIDGLDNIVSHSTGTTSNLDWRIFTGSFTASGNDTLTFTNLTGGPNEGIFLDAVSVAAVPEPATWAMMLVGFGAIGFQLRRKRSSRLMQVA